MKTAVLDIGKTNIKLTLIDAQGREREKHQRINAALPGPPWLHPDLAGIEAWLLQHLRDMAEGQALDAFIATGHGSGGVLVDDEGPILPSIDYEEQPPAAIHEGYDRLAPPFPERGAPQLGGASHFGRQLYWINETQPSALARARYFLALPHYFAWRLTGRAACEVTMLGAQSHLWSPLRSTWTSMVEVMGWQRLMPEIVPSFEPLGSPLPSTGLPGRMKIYPGIHDSTANLYPYQCAGLGEFVLLSTGTWIVGMSTATPHDRLDERRSMCVTSDVWSKPVIGSLAMAGREYAAIAPAGGAVDLNVLAGLIERRTMALPGFVDFDGIYPGSSGRGRIIGPPPETDAARTSLGTLYAALVACDSLELLAARNRVVIDGGFTGEPVFAGLVAALRSDLEILVEPDGMGTAGGAALLTRHASNAAPNLSLEPAKRVALGGLEDYRAAWQNKVSEHLGAPTR